MLDNREWSKKATRIESLGLMIAPTPFVVRQRIYLPSGRVVMEGTRYFSWSTACDLISEGCVEPGWRLPTLEEAKAIQTRYNRDGIWLIALRLDGFITPGDMVAYNYIPKNSANLVSHRGVMGYYWTSSLDNPLYPHVITNTGTHIQVGGSMYLSYGLPLLLVKTL